ncbi:hypothetical protein ACWEOG_13585 [Amycolatopsis japonica]|uniref:hypothetical protein n=1 Tax=Amycolatopsis sp. MJM2582 TaxID=1427749 RepID=UPI0006926147|nr:hypothetical protein [Amycolatopsis sp. MJM2582]
MDIDSAKIDEGRNTVPLTVTFTGKVPLSTSGPNAHYHVWTYTLQGSPGDFIGVNQRFALALAAEVDVQDPRRYPDVTALNGAFLEKDTTISRQYAGKVISSPNGTQTISFVAPAAQTERELFLVAASGAGRPWSVVPFAKTAGGTVANVQSLPSPAGQVFTGRPVADFAGTYPYASEVFGVYQPLVGWMGAQSSERFAGERVPGAAVAALADEAPVEGILSPVGLVNLFREYFFEFDTFLGVPAGHLWLSPGGTVEVVETSSRRTLTERTAEQSEQTTRRVEESLTEQTDVADAVKEDNANDTTLGASASAGAKFAGIYHGDVSTTFSTTTSTGKSSEQTHKHSRTQSSKVSSEIVRNFKTTFKTVTETTDTSSRRYVVQNTTNKLVNYELRRKMRKVGVQMQHLGTQLSWQVFLGPGGITPPGTDPKPSVAPGRKLGLGELVHVVPAPDLSSLRKPEPLAALEEKTVTFTGVFPFRWYHRENSNPPHNGATYLLDGSLLWMNNEDEDNEHVHAVNDFVAVPPAPGYKLSDRIVVLEAKNGNGGPAKLIPHHIEVRPENAKSGKFSLTASEASWAGTDSMTLTFSLTWVPPESHPDQGSYDRALKEYEAAVAVIQRRTYAQAVSDRVDLVSKVRARSSEELRKEERQVVFADLVKQLNKQVPDGHLAAELIRQMFDVDRMLYFVAPDYWRPMNVTDPAGPDTKGRYPVPPHNWDNKSPDPIDGETVVSWYSHTSSENRGPGDPVKDPEYRVNYLITEKSNPAPTGSSLGWLIQSDGDERRNEFLNAAWVKVVLPIRPGHETKAIDWLKRADVEGEAALGKQYEWQTGDPETWRGQTIGWVLDELAKELEAANTNMDNTLATERVFETGFDPLDGGFRPALPYQIFDEWVEVLPTDQVVAVEVEYDPKTGQQR